MRFTKTSHKPVRQKSLSLQSGDNLALWLMALPGIVLFLCFAYLPMAGIILAFKSFRPKLGIFGSPWAHFKNFEFMFRNATFWLTVRNTLLYNIVFLIIGILGPLTFALAINEVRPKRAARVYQTLTIMPHFVSYVVVSVIVFAILSADSGMLGNFYKQQGLRPIVFYSEPKYWPWILSLVYLWKHIGYSSIIYLGTITGISDEFFEAAVIDGASKWQQIKYITLPFLTPMVVVLAIIRVGAMFSSNFDLFYQVPMNSGQLYPVTNTINVFTYNTLRNSNNVSLSAAVGFVQSVAGFLLVVTTNRVIKAVDPDLAMF